jgi:hypothetical protein
MLDLAAAAPKMKVAGEFVMGEARAHQFPVLMVPYDQLIIISVCLDSWRFHSTDIYTKAHCTVRLWCNVTVNSLTKVVVAVKPDSCLL